MSLTSLNDVWLVQDTRPNDIWSGLAVWWGPNRCGYVTDLDRAGCYSEEEAKRIARGRATDRAVRLADALSCAMKVCDVNDLQRAIQSSAGGKQP